MLWHYGKLTKSSTWWMQIAEGC